ncbi:MAG TPA: hypothetical protein VER17_05170 [Tepidisphaeraceae bacterium]|nr:hypothetical protein [Tepidisphaeraceae bacterium]
MSTRLHERDDRELLDLLAAEDAATPREEWSRVIGAIREGEPEAAAPSPEFNAVLRRRLEAEMAPAAALTAATAAAAATAVAAATAGRKPRASRWFRVALPLAAAAVLAAVLLLPGSLFERHDRNAAGVAWADVVQAMQRVGQFHLIIFSDDPRRADEKLKMFRVDLFHRQPGQWRAQGMGHVAFLTDGKRQTWSAEKRAFLGKGDRIPDMLPKEFVAAHEKMGALDAILATVFEDKVPAGEPVKSDGVAAARGIDVFDYAQNASRKWARIWVLRESKLPLKMHLYYPGSDEFTLVSFDYSDPQPDAFFDPAEFEKQAAKVSSSDPYRAYSIGSRPVAGARPRGADQIHEVQGGYRAPKVRRVLSNEAGDVLVVTDNPSNVTPAGHPPHEQGYRRVTDNWGNRYIPCGGGSGVGDEGDQRWYFMPLPPAKVTGNGPRTLSMTYTIEAEYGQQRVLATEALSVPDPSVKGEKDDWKINLAAQKRTWYASYLQREGTLAEQLAEIERVLAATPDDAATVVWKFKLLREHGREPAAWSLFDESLRDRIFSDAALLDRYNVEASQYLLYLAAQGREDELRRNAAAAGKIIADVRASKDPRARMGLNSLTRDEHNPLIPATRLLEWRETYKEGPRIVRTLASKDGMLFVEYAVPKPPAGWQSTGSSGSTPFGWFWQPHVDGHRWHPQAELVDRDSGRLCMVYRWWGEGEPTKQVKLRSTATLLADNYNQKPVRNDFLLKWERTIDIPQPTIEQMQAWWTKEMGEKARWYGGPGPRPAATRPAAEPSADQWIKEADAQRDAGRFAEALDAYRKVAAAPREQWPEHYTNGFNPGLLEGVKRRLRISEAQCLAELGRLDDARKVAAAVRAAAPATPDLLDREQAETIADALRAELRVARALLKRGDAAAAMKELQRLANQRPDLSDLSSSMQQETKPWGTSGWYPRSVQEDAWREYDALWWDVRDALAAVPATRPTTSAAAG